MQVEPSQAAMRTAGPEPPRPTSRASRSPPSVRPPPTPTSPFSSARTLTPTRTHPHTHSRQHAPPPTASLARSPGPGPRPRLAPAGDGSSPDDRRQPRPRACCDALVRPDGAAARRGVPADAVVAVQLHGGGAHAARVWSVPARSAVGRATSTLTPSSLPRCDASSPCHACVLLPCPDSQALRRGHRRAKGPRDGRVRGDGPGGHLGPV